MWNKTTGVWGVDPNYTPAPSKPRVPKHQRFSIVEAPPRTTGLTPQELAANARRNEEESRAIRDQCRREAEAEALLTRARAEAAARDDVFFQPHRTASALFTSFKTVEQRRVRVYWLDARGDMYGMPRAALRGRCGGARHQAAAARGGSVAAPETREVERRVTHVDDPETLAPGEWEYRRVRVRSIA